MDCKPFEIGLVGAGAVSAGAYTGGVIDFLVEALDAWYAAKSGENPEVPPHEVRLSVFSGASAGGITAALAAGYLGSDQAPIAMPGETSCSTAGSIASISRTCSPRETFPMTIHR